MYARGQRHGHSAGFTLLELLVVVVILGILSAVVIFTLGGVTAQAAVSACKSDARTVEVAVSVYEAQSGGAAPSSLDALTQGPSAPLQAVPSSPYYTITLSNGSVMVAAPSSATPVAYDDGGACDGANAPGTPTSVATTLPPTSTTTTTDLPTTTTTTVPTTTTTSTTTTTTTTTTSTTTTTTVPTTTTTEVPGPVITFPTTARPYTAGHNRGSELLTITGSNLENLTSVNVNGAFSNVVVKSDSSTAITIDVTGHGGNYATGDLTVTTSSGRTTTTASLENGGTYNG